MVLKTFDIPVREKLNHFLSLLLLTSNTNLKNFALSSIIVGIFQILHVRFVYEWIDFEFPAFHDHSQLFRLLQANTKQSEKVKIHYLKM